MTKSKHRQSKAVVTGECGNNAKVTGMAGIWSGALIWRQMLGGGRESRSEEWELHASALLSPLLLYTALMTHPHWHANAHTAHKANGHASHTHTNTHKLKHEGDLQLGVSADSRCLCPWLQGAATEDGKIDRDRRDVSTKCSSSFLWQGEVVKQKHQLFAGLEEK